MTNRTIIPSSRIDQILLIAFLVFFVPLFKAAFSKSFFYMASFIFVEIVLFTGAYIFQDQPKVSADTKEYENVINSISLIETNLSGLSTFLKGERERVSETEATVRKLASEKEHLEPVVNANRNIVDAILTAHAEKTSRSAWKERFIGFTLGIIASLIAAYAFDYVKHRSTPNPPLNSDPAAVGQVLQPR